MATGKVIHYLRRGWNEVPEVVVALSLMTYGAAMGVYKYQREAKLGFKAHMYKDQYTVKRRSDVADPNHPGYN